MKLRLGRRRSREEGWGRGDGFGARKKSWGRDARTREAGVGAKAQGTGWRRRGTGNGRQVRCRPTLAPLDLPTTDGWGDEEWPVR
jgi:hypothetical protein